MHQGPKLVLIRALALAALFVCLGGKAANAWLFDEHQRVCRNAYQAVCARLENEAKRNPDAQARYRIACLPQPSRAELYGQACAISGDLVAQPDDLASGLGGIYATSDTHYFALALINIEHFQPHSVEFWLRNQRDALTRALSISADKRASDQIPEFESAFLISAFANHFLADSFAAGHMGFNRSASSAGAAREYHNFWNDHGRQVRSADGDVWKAYGDGGLHEKGNECHVTKALDHAIWAFLTAFVLGDEAAASQATTAAWRSIPREIQTLHSWHEWFWFNSDQADRTPPDASWESIALARQHAKYAYALSLGSTFAFNSRYGDEQDYVGRLAWGPYGFDVPFFRTAYLGLEVGGGRRAGGSDPNHPDAEWRPVADLDLALSLGQTRNGLVREDFVLGMRLFGVGRRAPWLGLRVNVEFGPALIALTGGIASTVYDDDSSEGWQFRSPAYLAAISGGGISGKYPGALGIPHVNVLGREPPGSTKSFMIEPILTTFGRADEFLTGTMLRLSFGRLDQIRGDLHGGFAHLFRGVGLDDAWSRFFAWRLDLAIPFAKAGNTTFDAIAGIDAFAWSRGGSLLGLRGTWEHHPDTYARDDSFCHLVTGYEIGYGATHYAAPSDDRWCWFCRPSLKLGLSVGWHFGHRSS